MSAESPPREGGEAVIASATAAPLNRGRWRWRPVALAVVLAVAFVVAAKTPEFLTGDNFLTVLRAASITGIVALGMTFVTISGNYFSLSVVQTAVLASVIYAAVATGSGFVVGLVLAVAAAGGVGLLEGAIIGAGGNPVVVTIACGATITGGVLYATDSNRVVLNAPDHSLAVEFGRGEPLGVPMATWAFVLTAVICFVLLSRTSLGRNTYLVGASRRAAVASGLRVRRTVMIVFGVSALAACLAGLLNTAEFGVADASQFTGLDINAIAAVLVGGTAIKGGEGSVLRTCVGTLFIAVLQNLLQLRGYSYGARTFCVGLAVVLAVSAYALTRNRAV
jgi:ribose transport system permease protein